MMDKKTLLIIAGCVLALFGGQMLINKLYPPTPKKPQPIAETNTAVTAAVTTTTAAPVEVKTEIKPAAPEPVGPRPPEETLVLSNEFVRVEFTSWGGGIKSVELLQHKANGHGNVVLNADASAPALALPGLAGAEATYALTQTSATSVVLRARSQTGIEVTKTISLGENYLLHGQLAFSPAITQNVALVIGTALPALPREGAQYLGVDWLVDSKYQHRDYKKITKNAAKDITQESTAARWAAVKDQFFTMILTPATNAVAVHYETGSYPDVAGWTAQKPCPAVSATVELPASATEFTLYAGPKEYKRLVALGKGQEEVMQFGMWGAISVLLLKSMNFCHRLIPSYGIAIILITLAIKIIFWPIQAKSIKAMKEMQKFQPLMAKIKEKYKDDAQRQQQEMMKLYKEHKINPFSGCLPMLVQIPVFFGLFAMLRSAVELRGASFLWIKDLAQPDTIFSLGSLPVNPLPLLMTGSMVWQQKITPTAGDSQQAKMMMFMPLMMLFFFYNASSGLTLYWTVQQFLSIAQQLWSMRKKDATAAGATGKTS